MFQSNVEKVCHVIIVQRIEKYLTFPAYQNILSFLPLPISM